MISMIMPRKQQLARLKIICHILLIEEQTLVIVLDSEEPLQVHISN